MIRNPEKVSAFEREFLKSFPPDYRQALEIFTALYKEARALGVLPPEDPLEGIEVDIRIAKILNSCLKNS
jgi:hypothetical protein